MFYLYTHLLHMHLFLLYNVTYVQFVFLLQFTVYTSAMDASATRKLCISVFRRTDASHFVYSQVRVIQNESQCSCHVSSFLASHWSGFGARASSTASFWLSRTSASFFRGSSHNLHSSLKFWRFSHSTSYD